jgi:iron only hydrogenase large subunit-like protein
MPCYDKKLEAVRPTFNVESNGDLQPHMEVDTVLATHELLELFETMNIDFRSIQPAKESVGQFNINNFYNR